MPSPPGHLVLVNDAAGSAKREAVDAACEVLRRRSDVSVLSTASPEDLDDAIGQLDGRFLVIAGGDGSIHLALNRLRALERLDDVVVGLLPLGTGNDLARTLEIPLDPVEAAEVLVGGTSRSLDLLVDDDGLVVVNAVHAGLGAEAAQRSEPMKERLGPLAYPVGALIAAVGEEGWHIEVTVDGTPIGPDGPLLMIGVANGASIGGGTQLAPDADPGDGLADIVVVGAVGPAARLAFGGALRRGTHLERDDVIHARGVEVRLRGDAIRHNADGEISEPVSDRTYRLLAGVWKVICPVT